MYTRCPSCGAEISFEPPANREMLPEDYKHRIRCPICGVTIGVKVNKPIYAQTSFIPLTPVTPQPVVQTTAFEPVFPTQNTAPAPRQTAPVQRPQPAPIVTTTTSTAAKPKSKTVEKKSGLARNIVMMIFSIVFIVISIVGYLCAKGTIHNAPQWLLCSGYINGITMFDALVNQMDAVKVDFATNAGISVMKYVIPSAIFVLASINFIAALISAIGKRYSRAYNLAISIIICGLAFAAFFCPYVLGGSETHLLQYFSLRVKSGDYLLYAFAGWGLLQLIFALFFLTSLVKNKNNNKNTANRS